MKIMKFLEFNSSITKVMTFLEFNFKIKKIRIFTKHLRGK